MKNKFTPGPWKIEGNRIHDNKLLESYRSNNYPDPAPICILKSDDREGHDQAANASLISAAPDLYAALNKSYLDILNIINEGEFKEGIEWNSGYIEDALKKARGEQ